MNEDNRRAEGPGPESNIPTGAQSTAKPGSLGNKPDPVDYKAANERLVKANDRLIDQRDKLAKANAKLEKQLKNKVKALKGMQTQIANLKKGGGKAKKMHISRH